MDMAESHYRLLLIDDDEILLATLITALKRAGYVILSARDGSEGARLARSSQPDLIISDVRMPFPNGYELKDMLAHDPETAEIPFIFLTANDTPADRLYGLRLGADDYIVKPFDLSELEARISNLLNRVEISRQRGLREADARIDKLRHTITANFNHEMRTPLGNLLATLDLALRDKTHLNPRAVDQYIQSALSNALRLRRLIDDLIVLNDIDHGQVNSFRQQINPSFHLINPIQNLLRAWEDRHPVVDIQISEGLCVFAPKHEFSLAVSHLVDNAIKFGPLGGQVSVRLEPNGEGGSTLTVTDTGPGVPVAEQEKVFTRYYQVSQGDNRLYGGLGVGLTIARSIARAIGGDITFLNQSSGCAVQWVIPPGNPDWMVTE